LSTAKCPLSIIGEADSNLKRSTISRELRRNGQVLVPRTNCRRARRQFPRQPKRRICHQTIYTWIGQDESRQHWEGFLRTAARSARSRKNAGKSLSVNHGGFWRVGGHVHPFTRSALFYSDGIALTRTARRNQANDAAFFILYPSFILDFRLARLGCHVTRPRKAT
jgi:hypothetical protein